jgi:tRNA A-37 threonylcarbamoyl transferase component Bud32/membrane-associated phospholipid phosphatase
MTRSTADFGAAEDAEESESAPDGVAEQPAKLGARRRRPSGAPPPLPKKIGSTGMIWLVAAVVVTLVVAVWLILGPRILDRLDTWIVQRLRTLEAPWLTAVARWINTVCSRRGVAILGLATAGLVIAFRRFRHLIFYLLGLFVVLSASQGLQTLISRPRPFGVVPLVGWEGYSAPSLPVAVLTVVLIGVIYTLVPGGRARWRAKWIVAALVAALALARIYLGVDHPTDDLIAALFAVAIPVALFRAFVPGEVFPVKYGARGKAAHLDVTGRRGEAIRSAVADQLGLTVVDIKPVGLEGSGGSTPLRLRVIDEATGKERAVFAKLYARSHVRADRWYKLGRTMLYGNLEDETPFSTVRRFVEYEDYALRLLGEYGFPTPEALGVVEITPEREYLIAMEFFEGAVEIGEADIDGGVIDQALQMVRTMWDIGLAHRDIKPANLMVRDGQLKLIDVFFVQVRPSPWRQAVDLANMMLVLALRSDAETVYQHALKYFSPDELAEAFAAARGVASPTQLQSSLKRDGRDLLAKFRAMAPARAPIAIQRWSLRRVGLIVLTVLVTILVVFTTLSLFFPHRDEVNTPACGTGRTMIPGRTMILMAQAVPSASRIPCVADLPLGWSVTVTTVRDGEATVGFTLGQDSSPEVTLRFAASCGDVPADADAFRAVGSCIVYRSVLPEGPQVEPSFGQGGGLSFVLRRDLVSHVQETEDADLCGLGVPCR